MTPSEIEAVLQEAFRECEALGDPLNTQQREALFRILINRLSHSTVENSLPFSTEEREATLSQNPLEQLTWAQRQVLLQFIQEQNRQEQDWKAQLLNDWLHDRDSGALQFVRDSYGLPWLEQIQPEHIARYADEMNIVLKVGDRIEVSNGLWEWVQEEGPCSREWFPCTVTDIHEITDGTGSSGYDRYTNCIIRFDNGMEYEIQGIYEWNRYNWRWLSS